MNLVLLKATEIVVSTYLTPWDTYFPSDLHLCVWVKPGGPWRTYNLQSKVDLSCVSEIWTSATVCPSSFTTSTYYSFTFLPWWVRCIWYIWVCVSVKDFIMFRRFLSDIHYSLYICKYIWYTYISNHYISVVHCFIRQENSVSLTMGERWGKQRQSIQGNRCMWDND